MAKRKTRKQSKVQPAAKSHKKLVLLVGLTLGMFAAGVTFAAWGGLFKSVSVGGTSAVPPSSFDPTTPAKEYIYAGGRLIATEEPTGGGNCQFTLSPTGANFTVSGGSGSVTVTTTAGCSWTAISQDA